MNILHGKPADRMPAVHFGYWRELLDEWAEQGHITKEEAAGWSDSNVIDRAIDKKIGWDFDWHNVASAHMGLLPSFEYKVLEVMPDGMERFINGDGLIQKRRPGVVSIPAEDDYLLKDRAAFEELYLPKMQFFEERLARFDESYKRHSSYDAPIGLRLGSVLGDIRNMMSVIGMSYMLYDDPDLMGEIIDAYSEMHYRCVEEILKRGYTFDFAHYWEDICFKGGPLISPDLFDEYCGKHYRRATELVASYGIDVVSLDCDGVTAQLLPTWFENGVNTMFPIEVGTWGDQFEPARQKFGKGMLGVGGMDKIAFLKDRAAVDEEIARMQKLTSLGGFIPCPDHRLMPGSKFELVQYYAEKIKEIKLAECE
jgi:uroporphyrinogen decarboxylase